jgi:hypothetical protein
VLEVERVAFEWRARFPIAGPLALRVRDEYADGAGLLEVRLLGLPIQRQRGREVAEGEALRYLAELPWVPPAVERNLELEWHRLDGRRTEVATRVGEQRLTVELERDADGDVVRASSQMRRRRVGDRWVLTPWSGTFADQRVFGDLRIPTRAEVAWEPPEGRFVYWRGTVTSAELLG